MSNEHCPFELVPITQVQHAITPQNKTKPILKQHQQQHQQPKIQDFKHLTRSSINPSQQKILPILPNFPPSSSISESNSWSHPNAPNRSQTCSEWTSTARTWTSRLRAPRWSRPSATSWTRRASRRRAWPSTARRIAFRRVAFWDGGGCKMLRARYYGVGLCVCSFLMVWAYRGRSWGNSMLWVSCVHPELEGGDDKETQVVQTTCDSYVALFLCLCMVRVTPLLAASTLSSYPQRYVNKQRRYSQPLPTT